MSTVELTLVFDGGLKHSSYKLWYGIAREIKEVDNLSLLQHSYIRRDGSGTSNQGEYESLFRALCYIQSLGYVHYNTELWIYGDSELVRNQIGALDDETVTWIAFNRCNHAHLQSLRDKCRRLLEPFYKFHYHHVPRKEIVRLLGH